MSTFVQVIALSTYGEKSFETGRICLGVEKAKTVLFSLFVCVQREPQRDTLGRAAVFQASHGDSAREEPGFNGSEEKEGLQRGLTLERLLLLRDIQIFGHGSKHRGLVVRVRGRTGRLGQAARPSGSAK